MGGLPVVIYDPATGRRAKIVDGGAIAVLPPEFNQIFSARIDAINTPFNLVDSKPEEHFVGNILVLTGDKNISQTEDAIVSIYAATAADEALAPANLEVLTLDLDRSGQRTIPTMNLATLNRGAYINCVSDQANISVILFGYHTREIKT